MNNVVVHGYEWNKGINYDEVFQCFSSSGFQSTNFGNAISEMKKMIECRARELEEEEMDIFEDDEFIRRKSNCTIFLGYDESQIRWGEAAASVKFLIEKNMIDCLVTTPGSIEKDVIGCLWRRLDLEQQQKEEKGSLMVEKEQRKSDKSIFEQWIFQVFDEMILEQNKKIWTPSYMLQKIGEKLNDEKSIYFWAFKNKVPIFCPEITNGEFLGQAFLDYTKKRKNSELILDILDDLRRINSMAMKALNSAIIAVGSGIVKHHMCKANCVRDGADFALYINEAIEYDGSDSGAYPDESVACGKIKTTAKAVKIHGDANIVFPLIVAETFGKMYYMHS